MEIKEALAQLDNRDDAHWTSDGLPLVDVMRQLTGNPELTRKQITEADPTFSRATAQAEADALDEQAKADAEAQDEAAQASPEQQTPGTDEAEQVLRNAQEFVETSEKFQLDAQINEMIDERDYLSRKIAELEQRRDALHVAEYGDQGPRAKTEERMAYIRSQNEQRAARRANQQSVLRQISQRDLDPRAPIDQAMARKTQRGTQRPAIPVKTADPQNTPPAAS